MAITRSKANDIVNNQGNGLSIFINVDDDLLYVKDINGETEPMTTYTGIPIVVGPIAPSNPVDGQLWVDTN